VSLQSGNNSLIYNRQSNVANTANVYQNGGYLSVYNTQSGTNGNATFTQYGFQNTASLQQGGSSNNAIITQAFGSSWNTASVFQIGTLLGLSGRSGAGIQQLGEFDPNRHGVGAPPRAVVVRGVMAELERIANHFGDIGGLA
jgi:hypothetical protein